MFCSMCGAKSAGVGNFCAKCGNPLVYSEDSFSKDENAILNANALSAYNSSSDVPSDHIQKTATSRNTRIILIAICALILAITLFNRFARLSGTWVHEPGISQRVYYYGNDIITRESDSDGRQEYVFTGNSFTLQIQQAPTTAVGNPLMLRYNGTYSIRRDTISFKHNQRVLSYLDTTVSFSRIDSNTITIDGLIFTRQR